MVDTFEHGNEPSGSICVVTHRTETGTVREVRNFMESICTAQAWLPLLLTFSHAVLVPYTQLPARDKMKNEDVFELLATTGDLHSIVFHCLGNPSYRIKNTLIPTASRCRALQ
jgi:hypothetical protein